MRIAVDAMGGDFAPREPVLGALLAAREYHLPITLVGQEPAIHAELSARDTSGLDIRVVHANEVVGMDEHAVEGIRHKTDSSIVVATMLVKQDEAQAVVSAGHTGACAAASTLFLGRIAGVDRVGLASVFPTETGTVLLIDIGATPDAKPQYLVQYALMGAAYMEKVAGVRHPRVGLLSNGEERTKGNRLVQEVYPQLEALKAGGLNFVGNVEGHHVTQGRADVIVCDGFTGNILIKTAEGVADLVQKTLRAALTQSTFHKLLAAMLKPSLKKGMARLDHRVYGGAPLLGVQGVSIVAHGRADARAVANAIHVAAQAVEGRLVETIASSVSGLKHERETVPPS